MAFVIINSDTKEERAFSDDDEYEVVGTEIYVTEFNKEKSKKKILTFPVENYYVVPFTSKGSSK